MQKYSEYTPTAYDTRGLALDERQDWLVLGVIRTRDSDCLDESNFATALQMLGGESDTVEVHRFGHWGPGWYEIILIAPDSAAETIGAEVEERLDSYSILNDTDLAEREYDAAALLWEHANVRERLEYIDRCGADPRVSIFAARRAELPEGIYTGEMLY